MNWLIFGDDWGRHPSTTQHLARALAVEDRVLWVNSLGMRAPRFSVGDLRAIAARGRSRLAPPAPASFPVISPRAVPLHTSPAARALNRQSLRLQLEGALRSAGMERPVALITNPVAGWYLDAVPLSGAVYLRLDDYPRLPGVDPELARASEAEMEARATICLGTARALLRGPAWELLPQGVPVEHFARRVAAPGPEKVLGFFGLYASWLDEALIAEVARRRPDWTLEFLGPVQQVSAQVRALPNVRFLPAVPFERLPEATAHWWAAWIPFQIDELTVAVNPLKAREYLAAGLACFSTPLPEVAGLPRVVRGRTSDEVLRFLDSAEVVGDDEAQRAARRRSVENDGWNTRAARLREVFHLRTAHKAECPEAAHRTARPERVA